jgi:hypothetical protein
MAIDSIKNLIRMLKESPSGAVFNPWWQIDEENDIGPHCPAIRRKHLSIYFRERLGRARVAIVGEALGYRGGHFTGIPMTSERMLLRTQHDIVRGVTPRRTSKSGVCPNGFSEPTATIVWGALLKIGVLPREFVLWNAFPWHSFDPHRGQLSNRAPNKSEQLSGRPVLKTFLELFPASRLSRWEKLPERKSSNLVLLRTASVIQHPAAPNFFEGKSPGFGIARLAHLLLGQFKQHGFYRFRDGIIC